MKYKTILLFCLSSFVLFDEIFGIPGSGNSGGRSSISSGKSSSPKASLGTPKTAGKAPVGTNVGESPKIAKAGGSILSAWGIISLVLFVIVGSALAYYISIFYPLICAKRGKYDVMEMTAV